MSTDKTLADVQPGGRVRLGDQRSDLVPGIVRCAECQFQLARSNLNMHDGTVTAGDSKTEPCPNGCGPLWPVTWETWAREGWAEAERLHLENAALSAQPSPGGQGDLLDHVLREMEAGAVQMLPDPAPEVIRGWAVRIRAAQVSPVDRGQGLISLLLAARQPVGQEEVRTQFEAWLPPSWSREGQADSEGDFVYHEDWVQGAWVTWQKLAVSQTADVFAAYEMWPDDLKARLSAHDLRRMNGWAPRTHAGDWRIDTSAGGPILVYKDCSVIEGEDARYVLSLIVKDALQPVGKNQVAEYQYRFWNDEMPGWSSWQPISKSDYERELVEPFEGREVRALYAAPTEQAVDLAADHHGMRVDYHGLLRQVQGGLRSDPALAEMVRHLHGHLTELGKRWYAGDRKVVDELLQLYGIEDGARRALTDSQAVGNG
ncbi:hypothetical protein [Stenotrophomonas muris]|uniref:hypothetical protein n=1 Tax=Stenotrophomonas muris TaxID=2963283 RepID=UPI00383A46A7